MRRVSKEDVPELKDWFPPDEKPIWTIQMITAEEITRCNDAAARYQISREMVQGIMSQYSQDAKEMAQEIMGLSSKQKPVEFAARIERLILGSVAPKCDLDLSLKLSETYPITWLTLTSKILTLSEKGKEPGQQTPSGGTRKSKQP